MVPFFLHRHNLVIFLVYHLRVALTHWGLVTILPQRVIHLQVEVVIDIELVADVTKFELAIHVFL